MGQPAKRPAWPTGSASLHDLGDPWGLPVGAGLGARAGEARLREVLLAGGVSAVRRAAETPLNLVIEARP